MGRNDAKARTIKQYLKKLLEMLWERGEGFSGKRPFRNSGWEYDLEKVLQKHDPNLSREQINSLIFEAIKAL
jgi:hypothetical protein